MFIDTHCHIQEAEYAKGSEAALQAAREAGVEKLICVGTDEETSAEAVAFAARHENVWASVGLHPHDAKNGVEAVQQLRALLDSDKAGKVVAIGECGLDYFYDNSPRDVQHDMLHAQLELAKDFDTPVIFHVREAFDDFWPIFDQYSGLRGVLHSYTDSLQNMEKALERGLFFGVNGISTFTKVDEQKEMFAAIPLECLLLETDAPFLTPTPKRGSINEPAYVRFVAEHVAKIRNISVEEVAFATTKNATALFSL